MDQGTPGQPEQPEHGGSDRHVVFLMRHARAEEIRPGEPDQNRELTDTGRAQSATVADWLRARGDTVDLALCSPAVRAVETLHTVAPQVPARTVEELYNCGSDTILDHLHLLDEPTRTALVVAHAPGIPALTWDLVERNGSDQTAKAQIAHRFPPGTIVRLEFTGPWAGLDRARLTHAHVE